MNAPRRVDCGAMILIVAGVSGSGKTTVGALLAARLHWPFDDGDAFHPAANIAKMEAGIPLTDEDREPWLRALAAWMDDRIARGQSEVLACSALKRAYRDELLGGRPEARMIFLSEDREEVAQHLAGRHGHFFPAKLLDTQFAALEPPQPDESAVIVVDNRGDAADAVAAILAIVCPGEGADQGADQGQSHEADA